MFRNKIKNIKYTNKLLPEEYALKKMYVKLQIFSSFHFFFSLFEIENALQLLARVDPKKVKYYDKKI